MQVYSFFVSCETKTTIIQIAALKGGSFMPLPKQHTYTSEDYWNLPDSQRAELIDGQLYNMAPLNRMHQEILSALH